MSRIFQAFVLQAFREVLEEIQILWQRAVAEYVLKFRYPREVEEPTK